MKTLLFLLVVLPLSSCQQRSARLDSQVKVWRASVTQGLPIGSSSQQIEQWASVHKIHFTHRPEYGQFSANVEKFPADGIRFPCNAWNVIVLITVDKSGRSTKNNVYGVGDCP